MFFQRNLVHDILEAKAQVNDTPPMQHNFQTSIVWNDSEEHHYHHAHYHNHHHHHHHHHHQQQQKKKKKASSPVTLPVFPHLSTTMKPHFPWEIRPLAPASPGQVGCGRWRHGLRQGFSSRAHAGPQAEGCHGWFWGDGGCGEGITTSMGNAWLQDLQMAHEGVCLLKKCGIFMDFKSWLGYSIMHLRCWLRKPRLYTVAGFPYVTHIISLEV